MEDIGLFLKQNLLQWIKLDQSSRPWKELELLSKVRNPTPYLPSLPQHTNTHRSLCEVLGQQPLSSAEASLCCGRLGERKRERARHDGKEEGRFPLPIVPRALSIFSIIAILMGIPSGSLCGGERSAGILFSNSTSCSFR